ncbi:hypothetical protein QEH52_01045 [Coraliomargarita sp. SDUM461003]|uniref:Uncharacterized protein n=1 Tax=Thalassobacterium maritimum TaxID=3041265 RepID=A0ABU1APK6_9BACT|nr:hypothetical protein [Coraliomargarita sp. SDUM461003]MDQ8206080.1 hypothetical protein [Coraliomargarita sp. SDUM461003]
MSFVTNAINRAASLAQGCEEQVVLEFLISNAVGSSNAQPWRLIEAHLKTKGILMSQQRFQQGILKRNRENDVFIGSNDHGAARGYFLIDTIEDARKMKGWYQDRINSEQARVDNLRIQSLSHGWVI